MLLGGVLATGAVGALVCAIVLIRHCRTMAAWLLQVAVVSTIVWTTTTLAALQAFAPGAAFWVRVGLCAEVVAVSMLVLAGVQVLGGTRSLRVALVIAGVGLLWLGSVWLPSITRVLGSDTSGIVLVSPTTALPLVCWLVVANVFLVALAIYRMARQTGRVREQARYLILAGLVIAGATIAPRLLSAFGGCITIAPWSPVAMVMAVSLVTTALTSRRLVAVLRTIGPWLVYVVAAALALWLYLVSSGVRYAVLTQCFGTNHLISSAISITALIIAFTVLHWLLGQVVDRLLLRQAPDVRAMLRDVGDALVETTHAHAVLVIYRQAVMRAFHPTSGAILVIHASGKTEPVAHWGHEAMAVSEFPADHPLIAAAPPGTDIITVAASRSPMTDSPASRCLRELGVEAAVLIRVAGRCHAVVLLGERASGDHYSTDDLLLLRALAAQAAIALENALHRTALEELNAILDARVAERTAELRDANARLLEADRAKDEFLAFTSHELITPLTAIIGWGEVGLHQRGCSDDMRPVLETILRSAWRQRRLVGELLDASRLIHGKLVLVEGPADLWDLTNQAVEEMAYSVAERDLTLHVHPPDQPLPVHADAQRIVQVVVNLLGNACKFTPAGGAVHVTGFRTASMVGVSVRDTGRGIPADAMASIFAMFQQVQRYETGGGLGLGLSLAKSILEMHNGRIAVESPGLGQGSTFVVELPLVTEDGHRDSMAATPDGLDVLLERVQRSRGADCSRGHSSASAVAANYR